jgi:hypothetical protein
MEHIRWAGFVAHMDGQEMHIIFSPLKITRKSPLLGNLRIEVAISFLSDRAHLPVDLNDEPALLPVHRSIIFT